MTGREVKESQARVKDCGSSRTADRNIENLSDVQYRRGSEGRDTDNRAKATINLSAAAQAK